MPPPVGSKQDVGRLYVDHAVIGYPQVDMRAATTIAKDKSDNLSIKNCCPVPLKVLVADSVAAFGASEVGQVLTDISHHKCIVISAMRQSSSGAPEYRSGTVSDSMLEGNSVAMLIILNESDLVVCKKSVPSSGARELYMDLESGGFALSASSIKQQLLATYQRAVGRIGDISSTEVALSDDDVDYFLLQRQQSAYMALLLPVFGPEMEDECMDLDSYQAFIERQLTLLKNAISACDFVSGEGDQVQRMSSLLTKLHIIDTRCGNPVGNQYADMVLVLQDMLERVSDESIRHLAERRYVVFVHTLSVLKSASSSQLTKHLVEESLIANKYNFLVLSTMEKFNSLHAAIEALLSQRSNVGRGLSESEAESLRQSWEGLQQAVGVKWEYDIRGEHGEHIMMADLVALKQAAHKILTEYSTRLVDEADKLLNASVLVGKLGQLQCVVSEASLLHSLAGLEVVDDATYESLLHKMRTVLDATEAEIQNKLRQVAVYSGSACTIPQQGVVAASLGGVPEMFEDLVGVCTSELVVSPHYATVLESVKGVIAEVCLLLHGCCTR